MKAPPAIRVPANQIRCRCPRNPAPSTLQYVTLYSNGTKGGFAGSVPVSQAEPFRCAYNKVPGANKNEAG